MRDPLPAPDGRAGLTIKETVPLVVGLGHPDRGDDAVGGLVVEEVARRRPDVRTSRLLDPLSLIDHLPSEAAVVVVDAALTGDPVGTVGVIDLAHSALPGASGRAQSSHAISLASAIELCRAAGTVPRRLAVVTVSADRFALSSGPQPRVLAAVGAAAGTVLEVLDGWASGTPGAA